MSRTHALLAVALMSSVVSHPAWSRDGRDDKPAAPVSHIDIEEHKEGPTQVRPGQYYTVLQAGIRGTAYPDEPKKARKFFGEILAALGGKKESREISVNLKVTSGGVELPEYALATYRLTDAGKIVLADADTHTFPKQRLDADHIEVELVFRDARGVDYHLGALTRTVIGLLPASSLVSELSKKNFENLADVSSNLLGASGSFDETYSRRFEFAPAGVGYKFLKLKLHTRGGAEFGTVTLQLFASPSLKRVLEDVYDISDEDLVRPEDEDMASAEFTIGGVKGTYLEALRALTTYTEMMKASSDATVSNYCVAANRLLEVDHGLTVIDRTYLVLESMYRAGYKLTGRKTSWYAACFNAQDQASLKTSLGVVAPDPDAAGAKQLGVRHLHAFGCWMRTTAGDKCNVQAPDAGGILAQALVDDPHVVIDTSYANAGGLGGEADVPRAALVAALKATASGYRCIRGGTVLVTSAANDKVFVLRGEQEDGRIASLSIQPASADAIECNDDGE